MFEFVEVYHIELDIEHNYSSVLEALRSLKRLEPIKPWISNHPLEGEDKTILRICVATTLESCITGCNLEGRFRRCCGNIPSVKSFVTKGHGVYPIIVDTFEVLTDELYEPTEQQVPDVGVTKELWLLDEHTPVKREMVWLTSDALTGAPKMYNSVRGTVWMLQATNVNTLSTQAAINNIWLHHPWLDRQGHCLNSLMSEDVEIEWETVTALRLCSDLSEFGLTLPKNNKSVSALNLDTPRSWRASPAG